MTAEERIKYAFEQSLAGRQVRYVTLLEWREAKASHDAEWEPFALAGVVRSETDGYWVDVERWDEARLAYEVTAQPPQPSRRPCNCSRAVRDRRNR